MATRQKAPPPESDNRIAALLPVNGRGEVMTDAQPWQMPAGRNDSDDDFPVDLLPEESAPETPSDRIMAMLAESGDDPRAYVKVSRVMGAGKVGWCDDVPASEFEQGGLRLIRERWGAGDYQLIVYGTQPETNRFVIRTRAVVQIVQSNLTTPVAVPQDTALSQVLAQMAAQQAETLRILGERPAPADPMDQMSKMFTMMRLMKEASGETAAPKSSLSEVIAAVKEIKGVSELMGGGGGDSDSPMGMLKDLLPVIQAGMAAKQMQPAPAPQPIRPIGPPVGYLPNPVETQPQPEPEAMPYDPNAPEAEQLAKLQKAMASLVMLAGLEMPPSAGAAIVYSELPDEMIEALEGDNWWVLLCQMEPKVKPFEKWFTEVREEALAMFDEPEDVEQNPPVDTSLQIVKEVPSNEQPPKPPAKPRKDASAPKPASPAVAADDPGR